jgi:LAO/AO transport system kinase
MSKAEKPSKSALNVQKGIDPPPLLNPVAVGKIRALRKKELTVDEIRLGLLQGDRNMLGRAITLTESRRKDHQALARDLIESCLPLTGKSIRIGITGVPGVGKSTFIEALGTYLTRLGKKLAVLAIDPSSARTGGSILGDKTRMEKLSIDPNAFIRPSPSAGSLGGVARKTREAIVLCEAAGFDVILVETVGVGQSETAVHAMVDFFLLLMLAGAGDELQGIKRGIMEMADAIVINKADGENITASTRAQAQYKNALHLFPPPKSGWEPKVLTCSALQQKGIPEVWALITEYKALTTHNGFFEEKRREQSRGLLREAIQERLMEDLFRHPEIQERIKDLEEAVVQNRSSAYHAANKLTEAYFRIIEKEQQA